MLLEEDALNVAIKQPDNIKNNTDDQVEKHQVRRTGLNGQPAANDAIKYRAYPNDDQYDLIVRTIGSCRFYWNLILDIAQITKEFSGHALIITPKEAKSQQEWNFLNEIDSLALSNAHRNYLQAWNNHINNPKHYARPTWKKRCGLEGSYTTNNQPKWDKDASQYKTVGSIRIENGRIQLPKLGWVKIREHVKIPEGAIIKNVTVSRDCAGRIFVSVGYYNPELAKIMQESGLDTSKDQLIITGLDYSNPYLFVNESGFSPTDVHFYKQSEAKLAKLQRKLARRQKGSANYKKLQLRIARLHRKIANQRKDLLHKLSYELATKCDVVVVEDLDLKAMGKRKSGGKFSFGKSISDNAWGMFLTYLEYKLSRHHGQLIKVDKWYPSSKKCHHCGAANEELELSDRVWKCPKCGAVHERDMNAAMNILLEGIRMLRSGNVAGLSISDTISFKCAGGTPVTALTSMSHERDKGEGVLPVEACKTEGGVFKYCCFNTNLRKGNADLREAGKEKLSQVKDLHVTAEAPASAARSAVSRG